MRVLVAGGGTGGHLYPAIAVVEALKKKRACDVLFVGTKHGIEARVIPQKGYPFREVWISGLHRGRVWSNLLFPLKVLVSFVQALGIVARFRPDAVFGTGGYVAWPVLAAARLLRKTTVIQEQNWKPGLVTRLLAPRVDTVHLSFEESKVFLKEGTRFYVSGNPTRDDLEEASRQSGYRHFGLSPGLTTLFVFGGSQGARSINQAVLSHLPRWMEEKKLQILWATGPRWYESISAACGVYGDRIRVYPYIEEMGMAYRVSDLVICRAGATTVAEVARLGIPAVFVPFPGAAGGHQIQNATALHEAGAAEMVLESDFERGALEWVVLDLLKDAKRRREMGEKVQMFGNPDAAQRIAEDILFRTQTG